MFLGKYVATALIVTVASAVHADVSTGLSALDDGDVSTAAEEFAAAYDAGDATGAFYLGRLFELGLGTPQDEARAANLYAAAAERGSVQAKTRLGLLYHEGRVLLRDYAEGTRLLCEAADEGDSDGQLNCGLAHRAGRGVAQDDATGLKWIEASASQGNVLALNILGQHHIAEGQPAEAKGPLRAAAEQGNALAMYELARLLMADGGAEDTEAYMYASLASVRGLPAATGLLNDLEARMSAEAVLKAQARARDWTETRRVEANDG